LTQGPTGSTKGLGRKRGDSRARSEAQPSGV